MITNLKLVSSIGHPKTCCFSQLEHIPEHRDFPPSFYFFQNFKSRERRLGRGIIAVFDDNSIFYADQSVFPLEAENP